MVRWCLLVQGVGWVQSTALLSTMYLRLVISRQSCQTNKTDGVERLPLLERQLIILW